MRALVVDDSSIMRRMLTGALTSSDFTDIDEAEDGDSAIAACDIHDYDLILMDYNMPNMNGTEAIRKIRANGKKVPIIMVTSESDVGRVMDAMKAGAQSYIVKPFKTDALIAKIAKTMGIMR